jgi:trehalose 6-phosphate synthase
MESESGQRVRVSIFPLTTETVSGRLLVLYDLGYVERRAREVRIYTLLALAAVAAGFGLVTVAIILAMSRGWAKSLRMALVEARKGATPAESEPHDFPANEEVAALLAELRVERKFANGIHVEWSPESLHQLLHEELPGAQVLIVSNREPYIHNHVENGEIELQIPASGLVSALEPIMRACKGTWIAHGSGSADRETVDAHDRLPAPPADPAYTLRRVWLSDEEQDGYYFGFANEGLWPLCHIAFVRPTFRETDWNYYKQVNQRFADAVLEEANCDDPIILVQDYHLALLPRMIRQRLPKATIITFWHIPWPNAEIFSICPWRKEITNGLLGSSILGFHTQAHCNNFFEAADRFMESRIDRENASVTLGGRETLIRPYPISIEWPPRALEGQKPAPECRAAIKQRFGLAEDVRIAVGVERFDYTKGILDRMKAIDELLTAQPSWRGKVVLIQVAAPTRAKLDAYSSLQAEALKLSEEINAKYAEFGCPPIQLVIRHHNPYQVFELFRAADLCVVSSLHDGMNLVAKEFVASRDDEAGVLILSSFAGASCELPEAVIVNPYDAHGMARAYDVALRMPLAEQAERIRIMRDQISQRNVYRWAAQMLLDAAWLRRREGILTATRK